MLNNIRLTPVFTSKLNLGIYTMSYSYIISWIDRIFFMGFSFLPVTVEMKRLSFGPLELKRDLAVLNRRLRFIKNRNRKPKEDYRSRTGATEIEISKWN